ncbi:MAG TPA: M48 family metalloprotease, partial [Rhizobiaceae bacterium]|nr:M48 family metalloprotease [Rhizobiaceae bacterium]
MAAIVDSFLKAMLRLALAGALAVATCASPVLAQTRATIVRDAEIESLLKRYANPILKAAGLPASTQVIIVNDPSFNAFVSGRRIFINAGAIMSAETPNQIIGVIAHEAGHLAGGHQERLRQQVERAQAIAAVSTVLAVGATVAGAASRNSEVARAGAGIAAGGAELARRGVLSYQRAEELTADRSALTYLQRTKQSPRGMLEVFEDFSRGLALSGVRVNPYAVSHPLPRERIARLETLAHESPYFERRDPAELQTLHDMARAKIAAYTQGVTAVRRLFGKNLNSVGARYGDAISTYLYGSARGAVAKIDKLIREQPSNPYLHEMRGEIMLAAGNPGEAVKSYSTAVKRAQSGASLIRTSLGHALVSAGGNENLKRAIGEINRAVTADPANPAAYEVLAMAYGGLGDIANADLATAEQRYHSGRY